MLWLLEINSATFVARKNAKRPENHGLIGLELWSMEFLESNVHFSVGLKRHFRRVLDKVDVSAPKDLLLSILALLTGPCPSQLDGVSFALELGLFAPLARGSAQIALDLSVSARPASCEGFRSVHVPSNRQLNVVLRGLSCAYQELHPMLFGPNKLGRRAK